MKKRQAKLSREPGSDGGGVIRVEQRDPLTATEVSYAMQVSPHPPAIDFPSCSKGVTFVEAVEVNGQRISQLEVEDLLTALFNAADKPPSSKGVGFSPLHGQTSAATPPQQGNVTTIGLDLAKNVFQVHGVDADGVAVVRQRLTRGRVLKFFAKLSRCLVGIEACATSHYWARELLALGHDVKLMPAQYVKPYVSSKLPLVHLCQTAASGLAAEPHLTVMSRKALAQALGYRRAGTGDEALISQT